MFYVVVIIVGGVSFYGGWRIVMLCRVVLRQARYVFCPGNRMVLRSPSDIGLPYESFTLPVDDQTFVTGWYVSGRKQRPGNGWHILFCHGNAGNIGDLVDVVDVMTALGFSITVFDYRGYGESYGVPSEEATIKDAGVCYRYLVEQRGVRKDRLIWFGHSLGAAVACRAATRYPAGMLVMEGAFISIPAMARIRYPRLPVERHCRIVYDNLAAIRAVSVPVLIAHSREDETCPFEHGEAIFACANEPKRFVEIKGGHDNGGMLTNPAYRQVLLDYAAEWLS